MVVKHRPRVHLEGMGLLGSLLAYRLEREGIPFTWHDIERRNAWRASTGLVYPAGDDRSQRGLAAWHGWLGEGWLPDGVAAEVAYWYAHKNPPHDGRYKPAVDLGWARLAPPGSAISVNVPALVRAARARFATCEDTAPPDGCVYVRAHGFNSRMGSVMWGWARPVKLIVPPAIAEPSGTRQPCFYSRLGRFQIVYAYPIPGTGRWWAGSTLVRQSRAHDADPMPHWFRWLDAWRQLWPDVHLYPGLGEPVQGWRPRPTVEPDDAHLVTIEQDYGAPVITMPPLWHSGVRWSPMVIDQATDLIRARLD